MLKEITNRKSYLVYHTSKKIVDVLTELGVHVVYNSKKMKYVICYFDQRREKEIRNVLYKTKGFKAIQQSPTFNEQLNLQEEDYKI